MTPPIRTLHIDIEGGLGGSSRSLFELVSRLDRNLISPLIAHRINGPIVKRYAELGIPTIHVPEIVSYAPREHKSFKNLVATLPRLAHIKKAVDTICALALSHNTQVIHLNYEGLFLMAPLLARRLGLPVVGHSRTQIPDNIWGRWEARTLARNVRHMFFISPCEEAAFRRHADTPGEILWNIASPPVRPPCFPENPVAIYLGNVDHEKGTDRLLDIAEALDAIDAPSLKICIYGTARSSSGFLEGLKDRIDRQNLQHRISFEGHTDRPEQALAQALALIRVSRWNDPWGRDVIEATRAGIPVLATGTTEAVVENGKTGFLYERFEAMDMAHSLVRLATDRLYWKSLSDAAVEKGQRQFSGVYQSTRATEVFKRLADADKAQYYLQWHPSSSIEQSTHHST